LKGGTAHPLNRLGSRLNINGSDAQKDTSGGTTGGEGVLRPCEPVIHGPWVVDPSTGSGNCPRLKSGPWKFKQRRVTDCSNKRDAMGQANWTRREPFHFLRLTGYSTPRLPGARCDLCQGHSQRSAKVDFSLAQETIIASHLTIVPHPRMQGCLPLNNLGCLVRFLPSANDLQASTR
jgi:hypothetical protein